MYTVQGPAHRLQRGGYHATPPHVWVGGALNSYNIVVWNKYQEEKYYNLLLSIKK